MADAIRRSIVMRMFKSNLLTRAVAKTKNIKIEGPTKQQIVKRSNWSKNCTNTTCSKTGKRQNRKLLKAIVDRNAIVAPNQISDNLKVWGINSTPQYFKAEACVLMHKTEENVAANLVKQKRLEWMSVRGRLHVLPYLDSNCCISVPWSICARSWLVSDTLLDLKPVTVHHYLRSATFICI